MAITVVSGTGKLGELYKWSANQQNHYSKKEKREFCRKVRDKKNLFEKERIRKQKKTAEKSSAIYQQATTKGFSSYLIKKHLTKLDTSLFYHNNLIYPLQDINNKIWNIQTILSDGTKRFLKEGKIKNLFYLFGSKNFKQEKIIYLAEGIATAGSLYMAINKPVISCFTAYNIKPVLNELLRIAPFKQYIICGDDDNVGKEKALDACKNLPNVKAMFPEFKNLSTKPTDFNDLHILEGLNTVRKQVLGGSYE